MASKIIRIEVEKNNIPEVLDACAAQIELALQAIGSEAVGYSEKLCPVDTGNLRNSITWATEKASGGGESEVLANPEAGTVYIGSNVEYAPYVEFGTGKFASNGQGRQTPWLFQDSKGEWHITHGMKPHHFLRDALAKHGDHYKAILEAALKA